MRLLVLAALLAASHAQAQMYKCVDARGVTAYSDQPCPEGKGKEVDIRGQPPISGKVAPYREDLKAEERDWRRRQSQRERDLQAEAKALDTQQRRCATLRAELQRASSLRRPSDSVAHDNRIAGLNAEIATACR